MTDSEDKFSNIPIIRTPTQAELQRFQILVSEMATIAIGSEGIAKTASGIMQDINDAGIKIGTIPEFNHIELTSDIKLNADSEMSPPLSSGIPKPDKSPSLG